MSVGSIRGGCHHDHHQTQDSTVIFHAKSWPGVCVKEVGRQASKSQSVFFLFICSSVLIVSGHFGQEKRVNNVGLCSNLCLS